MSTRIRLCTSDPGNPANMRPIDGIGVMEHCWWWLRSDVNDLFLVVLLTSFWYYRWGDLVLPKEKKMLVSMLASRVSVVHMHQYFELENTKIISIELHILIWGLWLCWRICIHGWENLDGYYMGNGGWSLWPETCHDFKHTISVSAFVTLSVTSDSYFLFVKGSGIQKLYRICVLYKLIAEWYLTQCWAWARIIGWHWFQDSYLELSAAHLVQWGYVIPTC